MNSLRPSDAIWCHRSGSTLAQVISRSNVDISLVRFSDIHQRAIPQEMPQPSITRISLKITQSKFHSNLSETNELMFFFFSGLADVDGVTEVCFDWMRVLKYHMEIQSVLQAKLDPTVRASLDMAGHMEERPASDEGPRRLTGQLAEIGPIAGRPLLELLYWYSLIHVKSLQLIWRSGTPRWILWVHAKSSRHHEIKKFFILKYWHITRNLYKYHQQIICNTHKMECLCLCCHCHISLHKTIYEMFWLSQSYSPFVEVLPPIQRSKTTVTTGYQFGRCVVTQLAGVFAYDCEYLGPAHSTVLTPLTERAYLSLTMAMQKYQPGFLLGPPGTGKSTTTYDLARVSNTFRLVSSVKRVITDSGNDLFPAWCYAVIWNNADLSGGLQASSSKILTQVYIFSFRCHNSSENIVCEMAAILFRPQYIKAVCYLLYLQAMGRHLVVVNCSAELTMGVVSNVLTGALQSGCWTLLDDINRIPHGRTA